MVAVFSSSHLESHTVQMDDQAGRIVCVHKELYLQISETCLFELLVKIVCF